MISHLLLLLFIPETLSSVLRVETGHQPIAIEGRDLYMGYYTKVNFDSLTCVGGLLVHCLRPLTGAEEIDLLYSACPKGHWRVAHYINAKEEFRLKMEITAKQLLIASREPLTIIDVQVISCALPGTNNASCHDVREHPHRHSNPNTLRAYDTLHIRRKRAVEATNDFDYAPGSKVSFEEDKIVPKGSTMTVQRGSILRFGNDVQFLVHGALIVRGTKDAPVRFEALNSGWKGVSILHGSPASSLRFLNISGALGAGITVTGGVAPVIENVISDSNGIGFRIDSNTSEIRIIKSLALNNRGAGFFISGKGFIYLDTCTAAANQGHGYHIQRAIKLWIFESSSYSNSRNGIFSQDVNNFKLGDSSISGNGAGIRISKIIHGKTLLSIIRTNISGHHYGPAILLEDDVDTDIDIISCQLHDNYQGGLRSSGHLEGTMKIVQTNFTRNRGSTVIVNTFHRGFISIAHCAFHQNQLNDYAPSEAVIQILTDSNLRNDAVATITDCEITKNIMNDILSFKKLSGADPNITIEMNDIRGNLARNVLSLNAQGVVAKGNFFNNPQSSCEVNIPASNFFESGLNYWGYALQAEIRERICLSNNTEILIARNVDSITEPYSQTINPIPTFQGPYTLVKALPMPYTVNADIIIAANQTVVVEPGTQFLFGPNVGITIQERGKLVLNGTIETPITMGGIGQTAWRGVTVKPDGSLMMSSVSISDPSIGIWLDSDRFYLENVIIKRPNVHGVEVTTNAGEQVDLGGTIILDSVGTSLAVDERNLNLTLRDFQIENAGISAVDFASPSGSIAIEDAKITNSGSHGIHISEYTQAPLYSLTLKNITLKDQRTGHAALLITGGWINEINIERLHAEGNTVPSIMLALECNEKPSVTRITDSVFADNKDTVLSLQLGECGGFELKRNLFERNNADGRAGVIRIDAEPNPGLDNLPVEIANNDFSANGGDFVLFLSSDGDNKFDGKMIKNRLNDNAVSQAAVIVASPNFIIQENRFENPKTRYQMETREDGSWVLNATKNWWGTEDIGQVLQAVKAPEGTVRLQPFLTPGDKSIEGVDSFPTLVPIIIPANSFSNCEHINYCSNRGQCVGNICQCPEGYSGADCSILTGCTNNCSRNGECNIFKGWTGSDCSTPLCAFNCGNHGTCVGKDECECDPQWNGAFCLEPACSTETCINGHCENKMCICEGPWKGMNCNIPHCNSCSLNGQCIEPETCKCFADWDGADCTQCIGPSCSSCEMDCDHGNCDEVTHTCSCAKGWGGAACDICETSGGCSTTGRITTILPQTADKEDINTIVTVFGSELPKTPNNHYSCVFGMHTTVGIRQSSSIIRCPIPANLTAGRHLFSLGAGPNVLTTVDGKPVHFTVYDDCNPTACQGVCVGPICVCPKGKTGPDCGIVEIIPEIDRHFLANQQANTAVEGTPYVVYLPTMPGTVLRVNSSVSNLRLDSSKGLLEWPDPVGQEIPHNITVTAHSLAGESTMSWNISVKPTYTAIVEDVEAQGNKLFLRGKAEGQEIKQMPVTIKIRSADGRRIEELTTTTNNDGRFTYAYIPAEPGEYIVSASHPGEESQAQREFRVVAEPAPTITIESGNFVIDIPKEQNCTASSLPRGTGEVITGQTNKGTSILVRPTTTNEFFVQVDCENGRELIRIPQEEGLSTGVSAYPERLLLYQNISAALSSPITIFIHPGNNSLKSPVELHSDIPLHIINTYPTLDDYRFINNYGLSASFQTEVKNLKNGTITIVSDQEDLKKISLAIISPLLFQQYGSMVLNVCIRDEFHDQGPPDQKMIASLSFTNYEMGFDLTRNNVVVNGEPVAFNIQEGYYQVTCSSPFHNTFSQFIQVSLHNSSFCLYLITASPIIPSLSDGQWITSMISKPIGLLPFLDFNPSIINEETSTDVLVTVKGDAPGVLSIEGNNLFKPKVQSVHSNDSFWAIANIHLESSSNAQCSAYLAPIRFDFLPNEAENVVKSFSRIIVEKKGQPTGKKILCDEDGKEVPIGTTTSILCNCGEGAKARCRQEYRAATACGSSWSRIPDDTVSPHVLSMFLLLVSDCKDVHIVFDDLSSILACVASLESNCPVVPDRKKRQLTDYPTPPPLEINEMQADGPASIINRIAAIQAINVPMQSNLINVLNAIDMQSFRVAALYQDFFDHIKKVFPYEIPNRNEMENFIKAIGDKSQDGLLISDNEMKQISTKELAILWNDTIDVWTSGKMNKTKGIKFEDAKQLVVAADKLKSFARQNGATDPFAVLHEYFGKLLTTPLTPNQECAQATVLIEPNPIYDGDTIKIRVFLTNTKERPLTSPSLEFEILRGDNLAPEATVVANGIGINPNTATGVLSPGESLETTWWKRIIPQRTLTTAVKYQPVVTVAFSVGGRLTKQRLTVPPIEIRPVRSAKIVHFVYSSLSPNNPFSIVTSIMNIGYSTFNNVKVHSYEILVAAENGGLVPYVLDNINLDGHTIEKSLSFDVGTILSGDSKIIVTNISSEVHQSRIVSAKCPISVDGQLINIQEMSTYFVEATAGRNGLMVMDKTGAKFFFRPDSGTMVNIVPLTFDKTTESSDSDKKVVTGYFKNDQPRSFAGYLWGTMPYPELPKGYELVKVIEKANGKRDRQLRPIVWKDTNDVTDKLNFVDNGFLSTSYQLTYEFVFADPSRFSVPRFEQSSYRIQMIPDLWWPTPPSMMGQITADSNDGAQLHYSLYSPDNSHRFSADELTGSVIIEEPVEQGREYCLVMVARDAEGQESRVPVSINTGGPRQECYLFNTEGLSPSVSHWNVLPTDFPPSSGQITVSTLPTANPPTENPPTTPEEIDIPTPPELELSTTEDTVATRTVPTDSHISDPTTTTDSPTETTDGQTIIIIPTHTWTTETTSTSESTTHTTDFITPDQTLISVTTTEGIITTTESTQETTTTEETTEPVHTVTSNPTQFTLITDLTEVTTTGGMTEPITSITEIIWTMSSHGEPSTVTFPTHSVTPDITPQTISTDETVFPGVVTTGATIEPSHTARTSHTDGQTRPTIPTESTNTDKYAEACRKTSMTIWNLICELSKTVARRGG